MTNKEKEEYIQILGEYHLRNYNNGDTDDIIGYYESVWNQIFLKVYLDIKFNLTHNSYKNDTKNKW